MSKKFLSTPKTLAIISKTFKGISFKPIQLAGVGMTHSASFLTRGYTGRIHEQFSWIHAKLGT